MPKANKEKRIKSHKSFKDVGQKLADGIRKVPLNRLKRAKRIRFYHNGNKFFKGIVIPVSVDRYGSIDNLMSDLTSIFTNKVTLPYGVRGIYSKTGRKVSKIDDLKEGEEYVVCSAGETFKNIEYGKTDIFQNKYSKLNDFSQRISAQKS
ncbi:hypothetical protein ILUMI_03208 [Ignelater luminosus]|uniref:Doublecortin domain-containing protein n=1 Tax=Ignelater luminosus TaxID=2038154 RepID=A0A8K0DF31_IGNLU|nr:hypothetical protein ILUMI_03208 [Ignelater luminosus]